MDNYRFIHVRPSIDNSQVSSVREMILNRAKEKSSAMAEEKSSGYTASVQNDVMSQARASVQAPAAQPQFGGLVSSAKSSSVDSSSVGAVTSATDKSLEYTLSAGAQSQNSQTQLKYNVQSADNSNYTASVRDEAMNAARSQYTSRKMNLTKTLEFLNTQAAIKALVKAHSKIV